MPTNTAAWLVAKNSPLEIGPAPYTPPAANQIVVANRAVSVNPVDWMLQLVGHVIFPWIKPPFVLGTDVAGDVVEIGSAVTRFAVGDRVIGLAVGTDKDCNTPAEGAFQMYTVLLEKLTAPIPASLGFEQAVVLPLAVATAACGLFQKDHLALAYPTAVPVATGKTVLIWGGSTSVGMNAIQLAVAAGYEVVTTASPRNFEYVTNLGASRVFDYNSPSVVADVASALVGKTFAGALAIGHGSAGLCADVLKGTSGNRFISTASVDASFERLAGSRGFDLALPRTMMRIVGSLASFRIKCLLRGIRTKAIFGTTLKANDVGSIIFEQFLPEALASGRFIAAPMPRIIGHGLEFVQPALDLQRQGVSAQKVVVTL
jgi:NADPH:quinone reductase-like Zn-dependent oxidoreductase